MQYNLADGVTAFAQLRVLYSDRTRSFNQWQSVLYPNFKIKEGITFDFLSLSTQVMA